MSIIPNGLWDTFIRLLDKSGFWEEGGLLWMICGLPGFIVLEA